MNFQLEFALLAGEERRRRLLAEATQWRLLRMRPTALPQPKEREASWLHQRLASIRGRLTHTLANLRAAKWFSLDFNR